MVKWDRHSVTVTHLGEYMIAVAMHLLGWRDLVPSLVDKYS